MLARPSEADEIARQFVAARRAAVRLADYPGSPPKALDAAYAVQDAAIARFGEKIAGWKVGRILPPISRELGVDRLAGPIFERSVRRAAPGASGFVFPGGFGAVEAEFLFRIGAAPKAGQKRFSLDEAAALVDAVFVGFEIASSPFPGINALGPLVTISDFGNNNGVLVGPEVRDWRRAGIEEFNVALSVDGTLIGTGRASAFPDGPIGAVRFLLENLASRGINVEPGILVSTGAITGVHEVVAGHRVSARFGRDLTVECVIKHTTAE